MRLEEGVLPPGLPYLKLGQGPPLVACSGLTPDHTNPTGLNRRFSVGWAKPFAEHFTVYVVNRKAGLEPGTTMSDIAGHYAAAIEEHIGAPVLLHGSSTGGSVALQLAVDRPGLVRRLVLASAACRLSEQGRRIQAEAARLSEQEGVDVAWAHLASVMAPQPVQAPVRAIARMFTRSLKGVDPADLLATIAAEDAFDVEDRLGAVSAPTLVIGGSRDPFYSEALFRRTGAGVAQGHAVVFRGKGHGYAVGSKPAVNLAIGFLLG